MSERAQVNRREREKEKQSLSTEFILAKKSSVKKEWTKKECRRLSEKVSKRTLIEKSVKKNLWLKQGTTLWVFLCAKELWFWIVETKRIVNSKYAIANLDSMRYCKNNLWFYLRFGFI